MQPYSLYFLLSMAAFVPAIAAGPAAVGGSPPLVCRIAPVDFAVNMECLLDEQRL